MGYMYVVSRLEFPNLTSFLMSEIARPGRSAFIVPAHTWIAVSQALGLTNVPLTLGIETFQIQQCHPASGSGLGGRP